MTFHVQKSPTSATEAVGSVVALLLLLAVWSVVYVAILPPDSAPRAHVALQVRP